MLNETDLTPYLLAISTNPTYTLEMDANKQIIRTLLRDVTTMASDLHEPGTKRANKALLERVFACK